MSCRGSGLLIICPPLPNGEHRPQILGLVGVDNQGLEGIELYYDKELRGTPGRLLVERDASGRQIPTGSSNTFRRWMVMTDLNHRP